MIDYLWEYLEVHRQYIYNSQERDRFINGARVFLSELGINEDDYNAINITEVRKKLCLVRNRDLKMFFMYYPIISKVQNIVSGYLCDGIVTEEERCLIYLFMIKLFDVGLDDMYIASEEVKNIMKCS